MPYAYRKSERLRKNADFVATMKGKRLSIDGLSLFYRQNGTDGLRVGIAVSKKLANAVKRNRLRRQIRGGIMKALGPGAAGFDLVFMARQGLAERGSDQVQKAVTEILKRSPFSGAQAEGGKR